VSEKPGVDLADPVLEQRRVAVHVSQVCVDARDPGRNPFAVLERNELVVTPVP